MSVLSFVNFSLNVKTYDAQILGVYIIIVSVFNLGANLDFGFGISTVKLISEAIAGNEIKKISVVFVSFFYFYFFLALIFSILYILYFWLLGNNSILSLNSEVNVKYIVLLSCVTFFVRYLVNFLTKVFEGLGEFIILAKFNIGFAAINCILVFIVFYYKLNLTYLVTFFTISSTVSFLVLGLYLLYKLNNVSFGLKYFSLELIKTNSTQNINLQLSFIVYSFLDPLIKFLIAHSLNLNFVTFYETGKKIIDLTNGLIFAFQKEVLNKISHSNAGGNLIEFVNTKLGYYAKISNYYSIFVYGISNALIFYFIFIWFKSYDSGIFFLLYCLPFSLINFSGSSYMILMITSNGKYLLIIQTINVLLSLAFTYFNFMLFENYLGLFGIYMSSIVSIFFIYSYLKNKLDMNLKNFFTHIKIQKTILLNLLIMVQIFLLYNFKEQYIQILICSFLVYSFIFSDILIYIFKTVKENLFKIYYKYKIEKT